MTRRPEIQKQQHFADPELFVPRSHTAAGPTPVHVACRATSYAVAVDTVGKLQSSRSDIDGDHLICVLSERVSTEYLDLLRNIGISYIISGESEINLAEAMGLLAEHFGISRLLLEGGGHINGAFLATGLLDGISLLLAPGIDGRHEIAAVFDGISFQGRNAVPLKLKSVERRDRDTLWLRYHVKQRLSKEQNQKKRK